MKLNVEEGTNQRWRRWYTAADDRRNCPVNSSRLVSRWQVLARVPKQNALASPRRCSEWRSMTRTLLFFAIFQPPKEVSVVAAFSCSFRPTLP